MTALEKIFQWLKSYPEIQRIEAFSVDYHADAPENSSLAPSGLVEISRTEDVLGNVTVQNQYNFDLHFVLFKAPADDAGAEENANLVMGFQNWVQEQSIRKLVPTFGDEPNRETVRAQNGQLTYADRDGTGIYTVQLSINFTKHYEVI